MNRVAPTGTALVPHFYIKKYALSSTVYACWLTSRLEATMRTVTKLKRASFFVDDIVLRQTQKVLGVNGRAEVISYPDSSRGLYCATNTAASLRSG
jgi:hypothetical protein